VFSLQLALRQLDACRVWCEVACTRMSSRPEASGSIIICRAQVDRANLCTCRSYTEGAERRLVALVVPRTAAVGPFRHIAALQDIRSIINMAPEAKIVSSGLKHNDGAGGSQAWKHTQVFGPLHVSREFSL
jgi:hypothetical protein